jgi:hypothetical protein
LGAARGLLALCHVAPPASSVTGTVQSRRMMPIGTGLKRSAPNHARSGRRHAPNGLVHRRAGGRSGRPVAQFRHRGTWRSLSIQAAPTFRRKRRWRSWRWPGCWRKDHGSFLSPGRRSSTASTRTLAAVDVALTAEDLHAIDGAVSEVEVQGARYSDAMQRLIDR